MSHAAQAVAEAVRRMKAEEKRRGKRGHMDEGDIPVNETNALVGENGSDVLAKEQTEVPETGNESEVETDDVSRTDRNVVATQKTKRRKARKTISRKRRINRKARARGDKSSGRIYKTYRLIETIPESIRAKSIGRKILESIEAHISATYAEILADLPKKTPTPTVRFYLGKFQRDKILTST